MHTYLLHSSLQSKEYIQNQYDTIFAGCEFWQKGIPFISDFNDIRSHLNLSKVSGLILLIGTGGTEQIAERILSKIKIPILLIATPKLNSLAASLEIYAVYKKKNLHFLYWEGTQQNKEFVCNFETNCSILMNLNRAKIGLIGEPSAWLLTSRAVQHFFPFQTTLVTISIEELRTKYLAILKKNEEQDTDDFAQANQLSKSLLKEKALFRAILTISQSHHLQALTIQCFELLLSRVTACWALSQLSQETILGGCEGDLNAIFSMLVAHFITKKQVWMANPSRINTQENSILFAHCTIAQEMCEKIHLDTHMESGMSIGIRGVMKQGIVTILRISCLERTYQLHLAKVIEVDMNERTLCRTQIKVKIIDCLVQDWIQETLGNHQIIMYGDQVDRIRQFFSIAGFSNE